MKYIGMMGPNDDLTENFIVKSCLIIKEPLLVCPTPTYSQLGDKTEWLGIPYCLFELAPSSLLSLIGTNLGLLIQFFA